MDDLVVWLAAQLDEDERVARAAIRDDTESDGVWSTDGCVVEGMDIMIYDEGGHFPGQAEHIARHDPARVLRDVESTRRMLTEVKELIDRMDSKIESEWGDGSGPTGRSDLLLKLLALPYSDRPGFREEWKP